MTPDIAHSWGIVFGVVACLIAGLAVMLVSVRTAWIAKTIAVLTVVYAVIGLLFLTTPKWTEVVIKLGDFEAKIAQLEAELSKVQTANADLQAQISLVAAADPQQQKTAADFVKAAQYARSKAEWAKSLPAKSSNYKLELTQNQRRSK